MVAANLRWAESETELWITIEVNDAKEPTVSLTEQSFTFKYTGSKDYDMTVKLFKKVNPSTSSYAIRDSGIELRLVKDDADVGYWKKLTTDAALKKFIKTDWDLYRDEDLDEEAKAPAADFGQGMDFASMMGGMGGMGGMPGMGGMGGMGGMPGMGGPGGMDMSALASMMGGMGGAGGMPGMGGGAGGMPDMSQLAAMMGGMGGAGGMGGMPGMGGGEGGMPDMSQLAAMMQGMGGAGGMPGMGGAGGAGGMPDMSQFAAMMQGMGGMPGMGQDDHVHGPGCDHGHEEEAAEENID